MDVLTLTETQRDALQEIANIGASHAATALSQMVGQPIRIGIPSVDVIPLEKTIDCVRDHEVVAGVLLQITDTLSISTLLLISQESALSLSHLLLGESQETDQQALSEMEQSALMEVGNVMMSSFFDSLSELLGLSIIPGPPSLAYDMPAAVMDYVLIQLGEVAETVVVFNCEIKGEQGESFDVNLFLLPKPESVRIILDTLGVKE
jgi:chemotaxis protein CheC